MVQPKWLSSPYHNPLQLRLPHFLGKFNGHLPQAFQRPQVHLRNLPSILQASKFRPPPSNDQLPRNNLAQECSDRLQ